MNRRVLFAGGVITLFVAVWFLSRMRPESISSSKVTASVPVPTPFQEEVVKKLPAVSTGATPDYGRQRAIEEEIQRRKDAIHAMLKTRIEFFGKVIDEHGRPVAGAATSYILTTMSFQGSPTVSGPVSDKEGRFVIGGLRGPQLTVMVKHPDYYVTEKASLRCTYAGPRATDEPPVPTADNPAVFVLKAKGVGQTLLQRKIKLRLPLNGDAVSVSLSQGSPLPGADSIGVALESDGAQVPLNQYYPFHWKLTIQAPGGGVQERGDSLRFVPDPAVYKASILIERQVTANREDWNGTFNGDFFFRLQSGKSARARIHVAAKSGNCEIDSFLNEDPKSIDLESQSGESAARP